METIISGLLGFGLAPAAAILGLLLLKKFVDLSSLASHQELVNASLSVVATLYAILLGFLVAGAITFHQNAEGRALSEGIALCDIFRFAKGLDEPERSVIRNTCRRYNKVVLEDEWSKMEGSQASPEASRAYLDLWDEVLAMSAGGEKQSAIQSNLMTSVQALGECRRARFTMMKHQLPLLDWIVVLAGAAIQIGLMYLLIGEKKLIHSILIALVTSVLCLNVLLLFVYSRPFSGAMKISADAFQFNKEMFTQSDAPPSYVEVFGRPGH
jgi:hypothetical protein